MKEPTVVDLSTLDSLVVRPRAEKVSVRHLTGPMPTLTPARSAAQPDADAGPRLLGRLVRNARRDRRQP